MLFVVLLVQWLLIRLCTVFITVNNKYECIILTIVKLCAMIMW